MQHHRMMATSECMRPQHQYSWGACLGATVLEWEFRLHGCIRSSATPLLCALKQVTLCMPQLAGLLLVLEQENPSSCPTAAMNFQGPQ